MLHLAIMLEEGNIVDSCLNAQDEIELVVHFDRDGSHLVFDTSTDPAFVEAVPHLSLVVAIQFASEKSGCICGFDRMSKGFQEMRVEGLQSVSALEDQVRCVLRLHDVPVIREFQICDHRAILLGKLIQAQVQDFDIELICQLIGDSVISDMNKSIIQHFISNAALLQLICQPVVSVEIELQPKGTPSWNTQIAQPQLIIYKVKILGHTFAAVWFQIRIACYFIVPRTIRRTPLHRSKDMYQTGLITALLQNLLDTVFFAKILLAAMRKLNLHSVCLSQRFGVLSNAFAQRFCKFGIIENANPLLIQIMRHSLGVTERLQTACDHNTVITTHNSIQFFAIAFRKQFVHGSTPVFAGGLSNLTTFCYNMHEGKSPLGKRRAYPVSLAFGESLLVRLSLFGFGLSELGGTSWGIYTDARLIVSATQSTLCLCSVILRPFACPASRTLCSCSCRIPLNMIAPPSSINSASPALNKRT